jgi:hypothetical protein
MNENPCTEAHEGAERIRTAESDRSAEIGGTRPPCGKCGKPKTEPTETVDGRGPGWKCSVCGWWTWLDRPGAVERTLTKLGVLAERVRLIPVRWACFALADVLMRRAAESDRTP